jgi:hypothetical protein
MPELLLLLLTSLQDLEKQVAELQQAAPNLKAMEQYEAIREREKEQVGVM